MIKKCLYRVLNSVSTSIKRTVLEVKSCRTRLRDVFMSGDMHMHIHEHEHES